MHNPKYTGGGYAGATAPGGSHRLSLKGTGFCSKGTGFS